MGHVKRRDDKIGSLDSANACARRTPNLPTMAIPRLKRSIPRVIFDGIQTILVLLIIIAPLIFLIYFIYGIICILIFPLTFWYISSNFGMRSWDTASMQVYIDTVQRNHRFMYVINKYNNRGGRKPSQIEFYPHKSSVPLTCMGYCLGARYVFSHLSGVLSELENSGWNREVVYDFFQHLVEQSGVTPGPEFHAIVKKICSHKIHYTIESTLLKGPEALWYKLVPSGGKIQMWEGTGEEEVATFEDLRWMAKHGAIIKPQTLKVLLAIRSLDKIVGGGMWKFASSPDDVKGTQWQTVVKPSDC